MPEPQQPFTERRKEHALRALYQRVDTLEKLMAEQDKSLALLEAGAVTKTWMLGVVMVLALAVVSGAYSLTRGIEESAKKPLAMQSEKLDRFIEAQAATNIKTEAMYLLNVEHRPREEVRETVLRTIKEK